MAFTDLHEIEETFARLAFAISPEDYSGYSVRESAAEHTARTQQWRKDNPQAYRQRLDKQSADRRAQRAVGRAERAEQARAWREAHPEQVMERSAKRAAYYAANPAKAEEQKEKVAAYYAANPDKLAANYRRSAEWKRKARQALRKG